MSLAKDNEPTPPSADIRANLQIVNEKILRAAERARRSADQIRLVAVTKKVPNARVREAFACGQRDFAENYIQEALLKMGALADLEIRWHCIGTLQSNKVKLIADRFALIHSVDRVSILTELAARSQQTQDILLEVNLAKEESKSGLTSEQLPEVVEMAQKLGRIRLAGLMFMAPLELSQSEQCAYFARARELREQLQSRVSSPHNLAELSMGTSHDFESAVAEGATLVRIGEAIFGARK